MAAIIAALANKDKYRSSNPFSPVIINSFIVRGLYFRHFVLRARKTNHEINAATRS
jgi:hypothetical protein